MTTMSSRLTWGQVVQNWESLRKQGGLGKDGTFLGHSLEEARQRNPKQGVYEQTYLRERRRRVDRLAETPEVGPPTTEGS